MIATAHPTWAWQFTGSCWRSTSRCTPGYTWSSHPATISSELSSCVNHHCWGWDCMPWSYFSLSLKHGWLRLLRWERGSVFNKLTIDVNLFTSETDRPKIPSCLTRSEMFSMKNYEYLFSRLTRTGTSPWWRCWSWSCCSRECSAPPVSQRSRMRRWGPCRSQGPSWSSTSSSMGPTTPRRWSWWTRRRGTAVRILWMWQILRNPWTNYHRLHLCLNLNRSQQYQ